MRRSAGVKCLGIIPLVDLTRIGKGIFRDEHDLRLICFSVLSSFSVSHKISPSRSAVFIVLAFCFLISRKLILFPSNFKDPREATSINEF